MMSDKSISTRLFGIPAALLVLLMTGCSSTPTVSEGEIPPKRTFESVTAGDPEGKTYAIDQYDPIEGFNRRVYRFNAWFDEAIFLPVVRGYEFITPVIVQDGVSNFFSNLGEITNFTNSVLQLKPEAAATAFSRFVWNTTIGVGGLWDPASHMELEKWEEDFGQPLGHWGVGDGPYLVLPFLGPSNLRDTTGLVVDSLTFSAIDPLNFDSNDDLEIPFTC